MQKLIYRPKNGEEVIFSTTSPPYIFESIEGIDGSDAQLYTVSPVGMNGQIYLSNRVQDREITLNLHVYGKDRREMYENKQKLLTLVSATSSSSGDLGVLIYQNDFRYWWIPAVIKLAPKQVSPRIVNYLTMQIVFYCPDPMWRGEEVVDWLGYMSGGFKFGAAPNGFKMPMAIAEEPNPWGMRFGKQGYVKTFMNEGSAYAPIRVTFSGDAVNPELVNRTTGDRLKINRTLDAGDMLRISTEPGNKFAHIRRANGVGEDAMRFIAPGSSFFSLPPGLNELEYLTGIASSTKANIQIKFNNRYEGV